MKAVVFDYNYARFAFSKIFGLISPRAYTGFGSPTRLSEVDDPVLLGDDWAIVRTQLCGICGSDSKQVFLDANFDNPLQSIISFPQILGHEVVGVIEQVGPAVRSLHEGDRVVLNPWLSCTPRGINPLCPACKRGDYSLCEHFMDGVIPPGLHTGTCREVTGGFAPFFPAHQSMLIPIPNGIEFDQAVLADPFAVSLRAVLKAPPKEGETAVVYGCGTLGLMTIAILSALYPKTSIIAIARHDIQVALAHKLGATNIFTTRDTTEIIESTAEIIHSRIHKPKLSKPWLQGGVDVIYDTVASAETLEVGVRITRPKGMIVMTGVSKPARYEWTLHYFKEISIIGSNAFGIEEFEGKRKHGMEIYLQLLAEKIVNIPPMVTHRFNQNKYQDALMVSAFKDKYQAVKVVFDYTQPD
jgi:threonine dehydrogenase-like Zn-dependent dehydrogenase